MKEIVEKVGWFKALHRFYKDPDASKVGKGLVALSCISAAIYTFSPLDAVPDVIPIFGWLDDLGIIAFATAYTARMAVKYRDLPALPHEIEPAKEPK